MLRVPVWISLAFAGCLSICQSSLGQGASPASTNLNSFKISGTVVEHGSGRPLQNVMVVISPVEHRDLGTSYLTKSDGRFTFSNLPAGKYSLAANRRGFFPQFFQEHEGYSTAVAAGPDLDSEHIIFDLTAGGTLSGTVVDDNGDPVRQAQIWLFRKHIFFGKSQVSQEGVQNTDSAGEFTFSHLPPGTYFVCVQAHPWYAQNSPARTQTPPETQQSETFSNLDVAYPITYYGDTTDSSAASPITIGEATSANIQVTVRAVPAMHMELSGIENDPNGGGLNAQAYVSGPGGYPIGVGAGITNTSNNRPVITGLAPGHYLLSLQQWRDGKQQSFGSESLDVNGTRTLDVATFSETKLSGRVVVEGGAPADLAVVIERSAGRNQGGRAAVKQDGSFVVENSPVPPGAYDISLQGASGVYLKNIEAKGAKVSGSEIEFSEGVSVQLSLVAAKGTTRIDGIAVKDEKPFPGAMVLLIPKTPNRPDLIRRDQSDSDGTFTLSEVPPGQYTLVAIDGGKDLAYQDPSVIAPYLASGVRLTVPRENYSPVKVNLVTRGPDQQ